MSCYPCDSCKRLICQECSGLSATELRCLPLSSRILKFQCIKCRNYDVLELLQAQVQDKDQMINDKNNIISMLQEKIILLEEEREQRPTISYADVTKFQGKTIVKNCPKIIIKPKAAQSQQKTRGFK